MFNPQKLVLVLMSQPLEKILFRVKKLFCWLKKVSCGFPIHWQWFSLRNGKEFFFPFYALEHAHEFTSFSLNLICIHTLLVTFSSVYKRKTFFTYWNCWFSSLTRGMTSKCLFVFFSFFSSSCNDFCNWIFASFSSVSYTLENFFHISWIALRTLLNLGHECH